LLFSVINLLGLYTILQHTFWIEKLNEESQKELLQSLLHSKACYIY